MIGFDYTDRIAPAALKAAGCAVVSRYVMPQTAFWTKALRNAEAAELLAAGIPIMSNFESTADRMLGGAQAGHDDAVQLLANWRALGAPDGLIGWFSADWDVQLGQVPAVLAYLGAAAAVLGSKTRTGLYAGLRACAAAADAGYPIWQTVAWSGGRWDSRSVARQTGEQRYVGGVQVDVNDIINLAALGTWGGPTTGGSMSDGTIPPAIAGWWPFMAKDFPPGAPYSTADAAIWANAGARAAGYIAQQAADAAKSANAKLDQLLARPSAAPPIDVQGLAAALSPLLHPTTDVDALAAALAPHVGTPDPAAFAAELVQHIVVSSK